MSGSTDALYQICQRHIHYFHESFCLAVEHRLIHEHDGKPPAQPVMKPKTVFTESSCSSQLATSTSSGVAVETKLGSRQSKHQQSQQSAVADARSKFEQVLEASRQAAAAAAGDGGGYIATSSAAGDTYNDKKLLTTDAAAAAHCQKPENGLASSPLYSQLVFAALLNLTLLCY